MLQSLGLGGGSVCVKVGQIRQVMMQFWFRTARKGYSPASYSYMHSLPTVSTPE